MNTLQKTMENWFTAVAYADAGQSGWTDDLWTLNGQARKHGAEADPALRRGQHCHLRAGFCQCRCLCRPVRQGWSLDSPAHRLGAVALLRARSLCRSPLGTVRHYRCAKEERANHRKGCGPSERHTCPPAGHHGRGSRLTELFSQVRAAPPGSNFLFSGGMPGIAPAHNSTPRQPASRR